MSYSTAQKRTVFGDTLVRIGQDFLSPDPDVQAAAEIELLEFIDMVLTSLAPADEPPEEPERRERTASKKKRRAKARRRGAPTSASRGPGLVGRVESSRPDIVAASGLEDSTRPTTGRSHPERGQASSR